MAILIGWDRRPTRFVVIVEENVMTKKKRVIIGIVVGALGFAFWAGLVYVCLWFLFPTPRWMRKKIYDQHSNSANDEVFCVTISEFSFADDGEAEFCVEIDEASYTVKYGEEQLLKYQGLGNTFRIVPKNRYILEENDFFDVHTPDLIVTLIVNPGIHWDSDSHPVFGISVGDVVYLDYETGRANYLDWILNDMY